VRAQAGHRHGLLCGPLSIILRCLKKSFRPEIPRKAVYRLSVYFRGLQRLKANGIHTVSSEALAKAAGVKPTQLRKDLTYFGQFGTRGLGYDVEQLAEMISAVLGTTSLQPVVLAGVGNLGLALLSYRGFEKEGFEIIAAFDINAARYRGKPADAIMRARGYIPHVKQIGQETKPIRGRKRPARRWKGERTHSWFNRFRKWLVRYEKKTENYLGLLHCASAVMCWRMC